MTSNLNPEAFIKVLVAANPRKKGSIGHKQFRLYKTNMTVSEFRMAGGRSRDLNWDIQHGYVKLLNWKARNI